MSRGVKKPSQDDLEDFDLADDLAVVVVDDDSSGVDLEVAEGEAVEEEPEEVEELEPATGEEGVAMTDLEADEIDTIVSDFKPPVPGSAEDPWKGAPRLFIDNYAIVQADSRNLDLYRREKRVMETGPRKGQYVEKYDHMGYFSSFRRCVEKILKDVELCSLSHPTVRSLNDAIQFWERQTQAVLRRIPQDLTPADFTSGPVKSTTTS